jgi:hypothetical protein
MARKTKAAFHLSGKRRREADAITKRNACHNRERAVFRQGTQAWDDLFKSLENAEILWVISVLFSKLLYGLSVDRHGII